MIVEKKTNKGRPLAQKSLDKSLRAEFVNSILKVLGTNDFSIEQVISICFMYSEQNLIHERIKDVEKVINIACDSCFADNKKVYSPTRKREYIHARMLIYDYCVKRMGYSLAAAGKIFNRDHATALHAIRNLKDLLETNNEPVVKAYKKFHEKIKEEINNSDQTP